MFCKDGMAEAMWVSSQLEVAWFRKIFFKNRVLRE